jgi:hypothetical protein
MFFNRPIYQVLPDKETKMSMVIIGIDPGKSGCLWAIDAATRKTIAFHDIEKLGTDINIDGIVQFLKQFNHNKSIVISEDPHPHGQEGEVKTVYAGFEYGKSVGTIYGIVTAMGFQFLRVSPPVWKGHFALTSGKATYNEKKKLSIEKACYLSPADACYFNYKRFDRMVSKHDRAEAYLIAIYGLENHLISK